MHEGDGGHHARPHQVHGEHRAAPVPALGGLGRQGTGHRPGYGTFFQPYPAPVVQAAPWYLYFPYNAHFMTPGPIQAPFFAPPYTGGAMVNPYFPAPVYVAPVLPPTPAP